MTKAQEVVLRCKRTLEILMARVKARQKEKEKQEGDETRYAIVPVASHVELARRAKTQIDGSFQAKSSATRHIAVVKVAS
jgi:hypothetical protein